MKREDFKRQQTAAQPNRAARELSALARKQTLVAPKRQGLAQSPLGQRESLEHRSGMQTMDRLQTPSGFSPSNTKKDQRFSLKEYSSQMEKEGRQTNPNSDSEELSEKPKRKKHERDDLLMSTDEDELVRLGVDMTQLGEYMENIVKVVN